MINKTIEKMVKEAKENDRICFDVNGYDEVFIILQKDSIKLDISGVYGLTSHDLESFNNEPVYIPYSSINLVRIKNEVKK